MFGKGKSFARRLMAALAAVGLASLLAPGCGSKSGLPVWERDLPEAGVDAPGQAPLACGTFSIKAELAPLDLFIAVDTSGSMIESTVGGVRKIDAVRSALETFLNAKESAGIGVTISFFPLINPQVPELCTNDGECGQPDACTPLFLCYPSGTSYCATDDDCPPGDGCERFGMCGGTAISLCVVDAMACLNGQDCVPGGSCDNHVLCDGPSYAPSMAPSVLPAGASAVLSALDKKEPRGGTPTLPALTGALMSAADNSKQNPTHKSVVLLATDGFPTTCDPDIPAQNASSAGIPKVAAAAEDGKATGVSTFVVGVFTPQEAALAQQNLDTIAEAGGTKAAHIIQTDEPVSAELLEAFNQIRAEARACDYAIPRPGGEPLAAKFMKVRLSGPFGEAFLERRSSLADCDPVNGGYLLDKDPFGPEAPALVQLCPASCSVVRSDPDVDIQVIVDCADVNAR